MNEAAIAAFLYKVITNPNMNVPVAEARQVVAAQDWLQSKMKEDPDAEPDAGTPSSDT